ncbi:MAG: sodium/solute symporter [Planctomycetota bacterium]|nr:sodium/solute symporter [Planctomycetota bacterium]
MTFVLAASEAVSPQVGLHPLDYAMVLAYLIATAAIVVWSARRQTGTDTFFLGNRRMPWLAVGLSIMATLLSSITYLGLTGEMIKNGASVFSMYLAWPLAMMVVVPLFIPFYMRLRLTSAYGYLEQRFNRSARIVGSTLFLLLRLGWISMVMYTGSLALASMAGWNIYYVIVILGLAATLYAFYGGFEAVIWTDVLQAIMLFGGAFVIVAFIWWTTGEGPLGWWETAGTVAKDHTRPPLFSLDPRVRMTIGTVMINAFFWQICTHASDQVVLQRYSSTPTVKAALQSYVVNMASALAIGILLGLSGLALLHYYTKRPERLAPDMTARSMGDKLMPFFYSHELPIGFAGLILANFLCDAMQTLVAGVNSIAAVATNDLVMVDPAAGERRQLRIARWLTVALGTVCMGFALGISYVSQEFEMNIVDLMPKAFNLFLGPLAALFFIGMFIPRATARSALTAVGIAIVVSVIWSYWKPLTRSDYDLSPNWAIALPCLTGVLLAGLLSLVIERGDDHAGRQFTWSAVMRRDVDTDDRPS